ncbi:MAG: DNA repair exonuclease [Deferrisomatales bacterium]|nr:DNA repair exonuclease [Deferrisomatales bacterium]
MFQFLHAADIHLDSPLVGLEGKSDAPLDELRGATREALENLVQLAISEEVAFVLLAGDLYDGSWKDYNTGLFFVRQMARLRAAQIPVFLISGNHDAASTIAKKLHLPDNVHAFSTRKAETRVLDNLGVAIHGQGFASRVVTDNLVLGFPPAETGLLNIGLLHSSLTGRPGHEPYAPCTVESLRNKGYQYWALGHVHTREVVAEDPWVVFPGNLQGRHARETGPKGCVLVTVEDGAIAGHTFRALDVLRWTRCDVDAAGADDAAQVLERVRDALARQWVAADGRLLAARVTVKGVCAAHAALQRRRDHWVQEVRALAATVSPEGLWVEKVEFDTRPELDLAAAVDRDDALGGFLRRIRDGQADRVGLEGYAAEFADLRHKLPSEYLDTEGLDPSDPDALGAVLDSVRELLVAQLLEGQGAESR